MDMSPTQHGYKLYIDLGSTNWLDFDFCRHLPPVWLDLDHHVASTTSTSVAPERGPRPHLPPSPLAPLILFRQASLMSLRSHPFQWPHLWGTWWGSGGRLPTSGVSSAPSASSVMPSVPPVSWPYTPKVRVQICTYHAHVMISHAHIMHISMSYAHVNEHIMHLCTCRMHISMSYAHVTCFYTGPNDLSNFQHKCPDTYELGNKVFLYYHAKVSQWVNK